VILNRLASLNEVDSAVVEESLEGPVHGSKTVHYSQFTADSVNLLYKTEGDSTFFDIKIFYCLG
jgi:hypothetical protein